MSNFQIFGGNKKENIYIFWYKILFNYKTMDEDILPKLFVNPYDVDKNSIYFWVVLNFFLILLFLDIHSSFTLLFFLS